MLDRLAPQWDLAGVIVEPFLNALKYASCSQRRMRRSFPVVHLSSITQRWHAPVQYECSVFPASLFVKRYVSLSPAGQM